MAAPDNMLDHLSCHGCYCKEVYSRVSREQLVIGTLLRSARVLITAPRRSPATPNDDGSYALYTISKYSLDSHSETKEIRIISIKTGQTTLFSNDSKDKEPSWLKGNQIIWLKEIDGGSTELWIGNAGEDEKKYINLVMSKVPTENLLISLLVLIWREPFLHL